MHPRHEVKYFTDTAAFQIRETLEDLPECEIHDVNNLVIRDVLERLLVAVEMRLGGEDFILCFQNSISAL